MPDDPGRSEHRSSDARALCVVSHRLPVSHEPDVGWQRSPGGLVAALEPALRRRPGSMWLGHLSRGLSEPPPTSGPPRLEPLWISDHEQRNAVDGFANRTLWPALHGLVGQVEQLADWWDAYTKRGAATARHVSELAEPDSLVWVHDYHHFTVAVTLRRLRPDVRVGLFCHTPFDADTVSALAHSEDLAAALRHFHHIGVQTENDARELSVFLGAGSRAEVSLGRGSRATGSLRNGAGQDESGPGIAANPVGFDVDRWLALRDDPVVEAGASRLAAVEGLLAVGIDRADYTKGLIPKLLAFETLLEAGSLAPDDLRLVQVAVPTRTAVPAYQALIDDLRHITTRINARHVRRDGRRVIDLRIEQLSPREVAALMRGADLALITPVRDGMNLVALEYSVLNGDRSAGLVLGRGAGAAEHVGDWSELVDGTDVLSIAAGLRSVVRGLTDRPRAMAANSVQRQAAASRLRHERWVGDFLRHLGESSADDHSGRRPSSR